MTRCPVSRATVPRDLREVYDLALSQGWTVVMGRGHMIWRAPDGRGQVVVATSPSDWRERANTLAHLRRAGLEVP